MMLVEGLANMVFPPPRVNLNDPNAAASLPLANQLFPVLAWFVATLVGGWIAVQLSGRGWTAWLVAASVLVGEILDYLLGRHTAWVMGAGILAPIAAAWIAQKLRGRTPRVSA
jgi:predicted membrane-bound dolichyl-phosphate-mannose-protein mannosyltransferase